MKCYKIGAMFASIAFAQAVLGGLPIWFIIIYSILLFSLPYAHTLVIDELEKRIERRLIKAKGEKSIYDA